MAHANAANGNVAIGNHSDQAVIGCHRQQSNAEPSQKDCFAVIVTNASGGSLGSILLDRCTGNSWVLARAQLSNGMTASRWYPISVEKGEAVTRAQAP